MHIDSIEENVCVRERESNSGRLGALSLRGSLVIALSLSLSLSLALALARSLLVLSLPFPAIPLPPNLIH